MEVKRNEEKLERPLPFRSVHGLIESPVRFINLTGRQVDVIWINYQGQEVLKASLSRRDNRLDCNTFMTHPWIAVDPKTNERMLLNFKETYFPSQPEIKGMDFQRRKAYALRTQVKITLPGETDGFTGRHKCFIIIADFLSDFLMVYLSI